MRRTSTPRVRNSWQSYGEFVSTTFPDKISLPMTTTPAVFAIVHPPCSGSQGVRLPASVTAYRAQASVLQHGGSDGEPAELIGTLKNLRHLRIPEIFFRP